MAARARRVIRWFGVALLFFVMAASVTLAAIASTYHSRVYPGVSIGGMSVGGQSSVESRAKIAAIAESYLNHPVQLTAPDLTQPKQSNGGYPDLVFNAKARDFGLKLDTSKSFDAVWSVGHTRNVVTWVKQAMPDIFSGRDVSIPFTIDNQTIQTYIHTQITTKVATPKPAIITVENGVASVTPAQSGLEVDESALADQLGAALSHIDSNPITLSIPATQIDAPVQAASVQPLADQINALGDTKVSFEANDISLRPTRIQLVSWYLTVEDSQGKLNLTVQKDPVLAFLKTNSHIDTNKSLDPAVTALTKLTSGTPPPSLQIPVTLKPQADGTTTPGSYTLGRFPGKYIEVNLAEQKLYRINGDTLEKTYLVSSGKASTPTPTGQFYIGKKTPRAYSYLYGLYMPWWEAFLDNAYGIHELPEWPNGYKEGEGHLGTPVSDGCVRLGIGAAKEMYDWTEEGTPVYIH